jgi:hypothetical protein
MQTVCIAELSLWRRNLEASIEDMLPMVYVDACTSEKIPMEWLYLRKTVVLQEAPSFWDTGWLAVFALLAPASLPLSS